MKNQVNFGWFDETKKSQIWAGERESMAKQSELWINQDKKKHIFGLV